MPTTTRTQHPVFVYGTLRQGECNYNRLLADVATEVQPAFLADAEMYSGPGFPYVVRGNGNVVGEVISFDDYDETLQRLDWLEGFRGEGMNNHYDRVLVTVTTEAGVSIEAWTYFAGRRFDSELRGRVQTGDWLACAFEDVAP